MHKPVMQVIEWSWILVVSMEHDDWKPLNYPMSNTCLRSTKRMTWGLIILWPKVKLLEPTIFTGQKERRDIVRNKCNIRGRPPNAKKRNVHKENNRTNPCEGKEQWGGYWSRNQGCEHAKCCTTSRKTSQTLMRGTSPTSIVHFS